MCLETNANQGSPSAREKVSLGICVMSVRAVRAVRAPFLAVRAVSGPSDRCPPTGYLFQVKLNRLDAKIGAPPNCPPPGGRKVGRDGSSPLSDALAHRPKRGEKLHQESCGQRPSPSQSQTVTFGQIFSGFSSGFFLGVSFPFFGQIRQGLLMSAGKLRRTGPDTHGHGLDKPGAATDTTDSPDTGVRLGCQQQNSLALCPTRS